MEKMERSLLEKIKALCLENERYEAKNLVDIKSTYHPDDLQVVEFIQVHRYLTDKLNMLKDVGYIRLFTQQDFKDFTKDGTLKNGLTMACCDGVKPYAWKIMLDIDRNFFINESMCKKHTRELCQKIMNKYRTECQCTQHCNACNEPWHKICSMCGETMVRNRSNKLRFFCDTCKTHMTKKCNNCGEAFKGNEKTLLEERKRRKYNQYDQRQEPLPPRKF